MSLKLDDYQMLAAKTAVYPNPGKNLIYPTLKLNGEAGEFADLVGKMLRDDGGILTGDRRDKLLLELGDVLWYVAALATELETSLDSVAEMNLRKLKLRAAAGKLHGSGSDR